MKPTNGSTSSGIFYKGSALPLTGATLQVGQEALRWDEGGVEKTLLVLMVPKSQGQSPGMVKPYK